jgi:hypothetical protein
MSPTKTSARKPAKRSAKRRATRKLSASHKRALAEGRTLSATVNQYLAAVTTPKRRGRKVSTATLTQRLADARQRVKTEAGVNKVLAAQEVRDLQAKLARLRTDNAVDVKTLEAAFVKVAKQFAENRGVTYGAWRDAGVPAEVLKRAGIARARG